MRKLTIADGAIAESKLLQWGRTFSSAETAYNVCLDLGSDGLQWGRTFSSAETGFSRNAGSGNTDASMGPHFFKCGNPPTRRRKSTRLTSFNGAALFQVRKQKLAKVRREKSRQLQWGRTFSSAETPSGEQMTPPAKAASMGPHFFKCGNQFKLSSVTAIELASMGPHFFKCGNVHMKKWSHRRKRAASMGPHFFKCGNEFKEKNLQADDDSFNGAALFQVRKLETVRQRIMMRFFQLQWGRTFSSAETAVPRGSQWIDWRASMGPHFFKCGNSSISPPVFKRVGSLQWGRTFSSAET